MLYLCRPDKQCSSRNQGPLPALRTWLVPGDGRLRHMAGPLQLGFSITQGRSAAISCGLCISAFVCLPIAATACLFCRVVVKIWRGVPYRTALVAVVMLAARTLCYSRARQQIPPSQAAQPVAQRQRSQIFQNTACGGGTAPPSSSLAAAHGVAALVKT